VFLFIRHGSWDVHDVHPGRFRGHGIDLLPLSRAGIADAEDLARRLSGQGGVDIIVSSPMTRALQTAMILSWRLTCLVEVELDLHEWVPDLTQRWSGGEVPTRAYEELVALGGEWPPGEHRGWEPWSSVRQRVSGVLQRYSTSGTVAVVCHSVVIEAVTGVKCTEPCGVVPYRQP
jgi:broad specificity phosphatase PhoE